MWAKLKEHEAYKRKQYQRAFEAAFVDTDAAIRERNLGVDAGGATAIAMLYTTDEEIYVVRRSHAPQQSILILHFPGERW